MKVLIIGQGGREHAIAWKLAKNPGVVALYIAPGNAGTAAVGTNVPLAVTAIADLVEFAATHFVDLTVVGPEIPLAAGVVDAFRARGLRIFGPTQRAAQLETSKAWAKAFMLRHGIPTAAYAEFTDAHEATQYLDKDERVRYPLVIKDDGLAAGKGVQIVQDRSEALASVRQAFAGGTARLVIEEFLHGFEVSFLAISDGVIARPLATAHDFKRAYDGDRGPMTGGMGAYSPVPGLDAAFSEAIMQQIIQPVVAGMAAEGMPYQGILYAGLMLTAEGPRVLEFNARFGDPETQVLLPRWEDDLYSVLASAVDGNLASLAPFRWRSESSCGVVLASAGYPRTSAGGGAIDGCNDMDADGLIFQGNTKLVPGEPLPIGAGGRLLTVVGLGATIDAAREAAYQNIGHVRCTGSWYRRDLGQAPPPLLLIG